MTPQTIAAGTDHAWMQQALVLAESVLYSTTPNPRVGCLIVRDGLILGQGATQPPGGPHAEVCALRDAAARGHDVAGATVYVTLEPCSHFGRTPPCADTLVQAGVGRVVAAMLDPNPLVAGRGVRRLREAGIPVEIGVCLEQALALNPGFVSRMRDGTPWVWMKIAASLDGRSALENGVSQWITGEAARADGHHWRARSCAILTGIGTVEADNPALTVRHVPTVRQPRRIIVDAQLRLHPDARILNGDEVWVITAAGSTERRAMLEGRGARIVALPDGQGRVDLPALMRWLAQQDINEVHVEAGAGLNGALLGSGCIDELLWYVAPMLVGPGLPAARLAVLDQLSLADRFEWMEHARVGDDLRLRLRYAARWQSLMQGLASIPTQDSAVEGD